MRFRNVLTALAVLLASAGARAESVLTVAMTAGDIPITTGIPDQGSEGVRFVGYSLYDALVLFDLSHSDRAAGIRPGLATSWKVDPADKKRWLFTLRQGVKWHDGCPFTADDVVWNFQRILDQKSPQFDPLQFALGRSYVGNVVSVDKVDDQTVAINLDRVMSLFPQLLPQVMLVSRCNAEALKYDRNAMMFHPSGTGPYRYSNMVAHERLELLANKDYWDKDRIPKHDKLVLIPMPEASTRAAALLSGQVNFIEAPDPDTIPRLKAAGMNVVTNTYPHNWGYQLNFENGPMTDIRVRRAANYALNRQDVVELLGGTAIAGYSTAPPGMPYYGNPVKYEYDPAKATALLKEAGCYPCKINLAISTSGSGQMQPLPMNEVVKSQLDAVGFDVTLTTMDWNALLNVSRAGAEKFPEFSGINVSRNLVDPFNGLIRHVWSGQWTPAGANWGHYKTPESEALINAIFNEFDDAKRMVLLTKLHEMMNDQAVMIWVAHDLNPRALSPKLKGFVQAQSWFQDLTPIVVTP
ncbi:MAG: ABC transporter substrate-binding protein [Acetobacteraceae bacterium]|nr:ABC transporter substrate-binding protein [Acetobacteraceae bacterium]